MREIKFRAWDKDSKKMFKIARFDFSDYTIYSHLFACDGYLGESCEIMQYTGLKDNNGVEVHFNDIVEDEYGHRYEVVFEGDCLRCNGISRIRGGHKPKNRWFGRGLNIIGNIYENPVLLEREAE